MKDKVSDLSEKRREKRQKTGWSDEEIKAALIRERKEFKSKNISQEEPKNFASGDMSKINEESDDEKN